MKKICEKWKEKMEDFFIAGLQSAGALLLMMRILGKRLEAVDCILPIALLVLFTMLFWLLAKRNQMEKYEEQRL
ncbi:hypothetical protein SAMN02910358_02183 [Lachnospiraceae bacterium XBB1006]|nr:hypothetical protein SAMN02910358_02183 [Lachnospiraceae bacterium XBB1006]